MRFWRAALLVACLCVPVAPAHATWLPGAPVDNTGGALHSVALGTAPDGSSVVAWVAADAAAGHTRLDVAVLQAGAWVVHGAIDTGSGDVTHPAVALGNGGAGVVTFVQSDGDHARLWASAVAAGSFTAPVAVDTGTSDVAAAAAVVDDGGTATVAFVQFTGARLRVLAARGTGGTWSAPVLIDTGAGAGNAQPALSVAESGGGVGVGFVEGSGPLFHAFVARYTGATWAPPAEIDTGAGDGNAVEIDLDMTSASSGVAAWTQYLAGRRRVYGAVLSGGVWSVPNVLDPTSGPPGYVVPTGDASAPVVSADAASGTAVVVWTQATSARSRVFSARLANAAWQASTPLDANTGGDAANPAAAVSSPAGDGAAIWYGWDATASQYHIYAASLANGSWSAPHDLGPASGVPVIAIDGTGDVLALWIDDGQVVQAADDKQPPVVALADCTIDSGHDTTFAIGAADPPLPCTAPSNYAAKATDDLSGVARVAWDFGDGTTGTDPTEVHRYVKSGVYQLRLSAWDAAGNTAAAVASITVADHDGPVLSAGSDVDVLAGLSVPFATDPVDADAGVDASSIGWDFGDGATAAGASASHAWATPGTYTVTVTAADLASPPNISTDTAVVHVEAASAPSPPTHLSAARNPTNAAPELTWDELIGADHYDLYRNGSRIASIAAPAYTATDHGLQADGAYAYSVAAITAGGATSARSPDLRVVYDTTPPAPAMAARHLGAPGVALHLAAGADESLAGASWDLGDGSSATGLAVDHVYATAGTYTGSVRLTDRAGNVTRLPLTFVISDVLAAEAGGNRSGRVGDVIRFDGSASGPFTTAAWSFGDGGEATALAASHVYRRAGSYLATLTVRGAGGRSASAAVRVEIAPRGAPLLRVWPVPASFVGDRVHFRGHATPDHGARIVRTWWVFGDHSRADGDRATHAFRRAGRYAVFFYARDQKGHTARLRLDLPVPRLRVAIRGATRAGKVLSLQLDAGAAGVVTVRIVRGGHAVSIRRRVAAGRSTLRVPMHAAARGSGRITVTVTLRRPSGALARSRTRL